MDREEQEKATRMTERIKSLDKELALNEPFGCWRVGCINDTCILSSLMSKANTILVWFGGVSLRYWAYVSAFNFSFLIFIYLNLSLILFFLSASLKKEETSILWCISIIFVLEVDGCCVSPYAIVPLLLCPIVSVSVISSETIFSSFSDTRFNFGLFLSSNSS